MCKHICYIVRMTICTTLIYRATACLMEHNIGFEELFFSKKALAYTIPSVVFGLIFYTLQSRYKIFGNWKGWKDLGC
jgi:ABC-type tungstate transport system substrate-binding protein